MAKMEEYYKLDAEDFIDDMPCRFKYKQVAPSMYGLSTKEMLAMSDRQLTQIMPLKKLAPYRHDSDMQTDVKVKARAQRMAREFIAEDAKRAKERKKNKGKKKKKGGGDDDDSDSDGEDADAVAAAAAEERKASFAPKAWGKHNMDNKPGRKRKVDTAEDADAGNGHHPAAAAAAAAQVEEKMAAASNNTPAAGQGKNAKKNAKKRMKKNQAEAAKAAGMI